MEGKRPCSNELIWVGGGGGEGGGGEGGGGGCGGRRRLGRGSAPMSLRQQTPLVTALVTDAVVMVSDAAEAQNVPQQKEGAAPDEAPGA